jgi:hypothetical protein
MEARNDMSRFSSSTSRARSVDRAASSSCCACRASIFTTVWPAMRGTASVVMEGRRSRESHAVCKGTDVRRDGSGGGSVWTAHSACGGRDTMPSTMMDNRDTPSSVGVRPSLKQPCRASVRAISPRGNSKPWRLRCGNAARASQRDNYQQWNSARLPLFAGWTRARGRVPRLGKQDGQRRLHALTPAVLRDQAVDQAVVYRDRLSRSGV